MSIFIYTDVDFVPFVAANLAVAAAFGVVFALAAKRMARRDERMGKKMLEAEEGAEGDRESRIG